MFWYLLIALAIIAVAWYLLRQRGAEPPPAQLESEQLPPSMPDRAASRDDLSVERFEDGSFAIRTSACGDVSVSADEGTEVHRYLAPVSGCACACPSRRELFSQNMSVVEKDGKLVFETRTDVPGTGIFVDQGTVFLRDATNATIALDRPAGARLHVLLRPAGCACRCEERASVRVR